MVRHSNTKEPHVTLRFGARRGIYVDITEEGGAPLTDSELDHFEQLDRIYRWLVALMYNFVPMSGHPGGSISSGRMVQALLFDGMDYDLSDPDRDEADIISYAAGHKALGLYAIWALRDEIATRAAAGLVPADVKLRLRIEDLLGFRRNPATSTPLFKKLGAKPLDGHPVPSTPFVRLSTGASGVGVATSLGLAYGAADAYGDASPWVHIIEGEGGLTPGRVAEALAAAGTASLFNVVMHIDWNQASIDSNNVCRTDGEPGDYVQWDPVELFHLHDWNVVFVPDGKNIQQVVAAQRRAKSIQNGQPTAVVYKTIKGWQYGIEGRASHGAGHKLCSGAFLEVVQGLELDTGATLPKCLDNEQRCGGGKDRELVEQCYWAALEVLRQEVAQHGEMTAALGARLQAARSRLDALARTRRPGAPTIEAVYEVAAAAGDQPPAELALEPGGKTTLREALGKVLGYYNRQSGGALFAGAADLLGSTSVNKVAEGFDPGYWNTQKNPNSRILSIGGICEDAMCGILSGLATYGHHIGVGSSYGAFIAALGHIPARLHAIGNQTRQHLGARPYRPFVLVCAHAGLKTGEDGPTHADPQPLQLVQENFPGDTLITLTPWEPQEMWALVTAALNARPAVIAPFVTRPSENILDRGALGLAPAADATRGVYKLRSANGKAEGSLLLQGSGVAYTFVEEALPLLAKKGIDLDVYYVASAELFNRLTPAEQEAAFPAAAAESAMGITGFTLPTMYRWVRSAYGRQMSMHPFQNGRFLGSGQADMVLAEAGMSGPSQADRIERYIQGLS
jgi:transketolase